MVTIASTLTDTPRRRFKQRLLRVDARDQLPITLRHERIYILPTRRGLAFLGVVMVMLLASMNYGLNLGYALSFIMLGLFASCLLSTYLNLTQLKLQAAAASDTYADNPLLFEISLKEDRRRRRHSINVAANGTSDIIDIAPNSTTTASLRMQDCQRGLLELGRITLSSDFPLGLWRGWGYVHARITAYVYPVPETSAPPVPGSEENAKDAQTNIRGEREYKQLKRYQETDSLSSVAWKQVARGAGWYSKEFEPEYASASTSIRWQDTHGQLTFEQRLSRLCAWVQAAEQNATPYSFELPGVAFSRNQGPTHKKDCLRQLASFKSEQR